MHLILLSAQIKKVCIDNVPSTVKGERKFLLGMEPGSSLGWCYMRKSKGCLAQQQLSGEGGLRVFLGHQIKASGVHCFGAFNLYFGRGSAKLWDAPETLRAQVIAGQQTHTLSQQRHIITVPDHKTDIFLILHYSQQNKTSYNQKYTSYTQTPFMSIRRESAAFVCCDCKALICELRGEKMDKNGWNKS